MGEGCLKKARYMQGTEGRFVAAADMFVESPDPGSLGPRCSCWHRSFSDFPMLWSFHSLPAEGSVHVHRATQVRLVRLLSPTG